MKIEIERKFLLASERWRSLVERSELTQGGLLSSSDECKVRVRLIGGRSTLTIKSKGIRGQREEFEYDTPPSCAERLLSYCDGGVIEKIRHYIDHAGLTWEVDEHEGLLRGVLLAEVELRSLDQPMVLPDWIGHDVTAEPAYDKISMLRARRGLPPEDGREPSSPQGG